MGRKELINDLEIVIQQISFDFTPEEFIEGVLDGCPDSGDDDIKELAEEMLDVLNEFNSKVIEFGDKLDEISNK